MPPKKNKRGARGSTDENLSEAKRPNMASNEDNGEGEDDGEEEQEPSLQEIKELLINIQSSILYITKENEELKEVVSELKTSLEVSDKELKGVKDSLNKAVSANKSLQKMLDTANCELRKNKKAIEDYMNETERLEEALDSLEQYTRKNSVEIHGIPESLYSNAEEVVIKVAEAINVAIEPNDIEICHKLKRNRGVQPILVKFLSHKTKSRFYRERTKLKQVKMSDIFPSFSSVTQAAEAKIFIHENLTPYRKSVVAEANKRRRNGTLQNIWTLDGKIYVKTSPVGVPIRITSVEDLDSI